MYDDLAELYVLGVAVAYIILFVFLAVYFVRSSIRNRKKIHRSRPQPPTPPASPA